MRTKYNRCDHLVASKYKQDGDIICRCGHRVHVKSGGESV
jgi:DNA-directed RNA polymerase subunit RPC12/RpoP